MPNAITDMTPHKQEVCDELSSYGKKAFKFIEFDDEEQMVAEIRKHNAGLVFIIIGGVFVALVILILTAILTIYLNKLGFNFGSRSGAVHTGILAVGIILIILVGIMTIIMAVIYRANVVFLTNDKVAQVSNISLFNRRVIQQSVGHIEDITVIQRGILPRIFDYGTLVVETAGDTQNLTFSLIPQPTKNSQLIMRCHENMIKKYGN